MDVRIYYRKLREIEETISEAAVVVISLETPDGGKEGVATEVTRRGAAKLILEQRGRLADAGEAKRFQDAQLEAIQAAEQMEASKRVQVTVVPTVDWRNPKSGTRLSKE